MKNFYFFFKEFFGKISERTPGVILAEILEVIPWTISEGITRETPKETTELIS